MNALKGRIIARIAREGPLTIAQYMNAALHDPDGGYYATRPALGSSGDFITAPETSQMFGELIGLWCAQTWLDLGAPAQVNLIELGPGRGVMMTDIWRAAGAAPGFREAAQVILCETSPVLVDLQRQTLASAKTPARWISALSQAPEGPAIIVGNEFLDCMPIRQFLRTGDVWREKLVGVRGDDLIFGLAHAPLGEAERIFPALEGAREGAIAEVAPDLPDFVAALGRRFTRAPGRALFFDYGAREREGGDTLQALSRHASADVLRAPGEADLTAHVDFVSLSHWARAAGLEVHGPVAQRDWLLALGVETRAAALARARPDKSDTIARQKERLIGVDQMGALFGVICLSAPGAPAPAGFDPPAPTAP